MLPDPVRPIVAAQDGIVSTRQLRTAGLTRDAVRWRLGRSWRLVLPGVVATFTGPLTRRQQLVAALLHAGEDAVIATTTAAAWHGVTSARRDPRVHVLVPAARRPATTGFVVVRRTVRPDLNPWHRGPLTISSRQRAVADAAREAATPEAAVALVLEAVQRRLVRTEELRHELEAGERRGSRRLRAALGAAESGAWSVPEADLAAVVRADPRLPEMWLNPDLRAPDGTSLPCPDGWFDDVALAVQVHSVRYHGSPEDWDATVMTDGLLVEHGIVVLGVTPNRLRTDPAAVLRRIVRAHGQAARRPRPAVRAARRGEDGTAN